MHSPHAQTLRGRRPPDIGWRSLAVTYVAAAAIPVVLWAVSVPLIAATGVAVLAAGILGRRLLALYGQRDSTAAGESTTSSTVSEYRSPAVSKSD